MNGKNADAIEFFSKIQPLKTKIRRKKTQLDQHFYLSFLKLPPRGSKMPKSKPPLEEQHFSIWLGDTGVSGFGASKPTSRG